MKTIAALILAAAIASPALAHEDGKHASHKTVIIEHKDGGGDHDAHELHGGKCAATPDVDVSDDRKGDDGKLHRSRILICNDGKASSADIVARLEKARAHIAGQDELSDQARDKALAAIDAAIARHKSAR